MQASSSFRGTRNFEDILVFLVEVGGDSVEIVMIVTIIIDFSALIIWIIFHLFLQQPYDILVVVFLFYI